jgi:hypothetical protein
MLTSTKTHPYESPSEHGALAQKGSNFLKIIHPIMCARNGV